VDGPWGESSHTLSDEIITPHATTSYDQTTGAATSISQSSKQRVRVEDSRLGCYDRTIVVTANAVSAVKDRCDGPRR